MQIWAEEKEVMIIHDYQLIIIMITDIFEGVSITTSIFLNFQPKLHCERTYKLNYLYL